MREVHVFGKSSTTSGYCVLLPIVAQLHESFSWDSNSTIYHTIGGYPVAYNSGLYVRGTGTLAVEVHGVAGIDRLKECLKFGTLAVAGGSWGGVAPETLSGARVPTYAQEVYITGGVTIMPIAYKLGWYEVNIPIEIGGQVTAYPYFYPKVCTYSEGSATYSTTQGLGMFHNTTDPINDYSELVNQRLTLDSGSTDKINVTYSETNGQTHFGKYITLANVAATQTDHTNGSLKWWCGLAYDADEDTDYTVTVENTVVTPSSSTTTVQWSGTASTFTNYSYFTIPLGQSNVFTVTLLAEKSGYFYMQYVFTVPITDPYYEE